MQIPTPRLILREIEESDFNRIFSYQQRQSYLEYNGGHMRTPEEVHAFIGRFLQWRLEVPRIRYQFAIDLRSQQKLIGNCGIRAKTPEMTEAEIGFEVDDDYWGRGYATEACNAVLEFAFESMRTSLVVAQCIVENVASARVLDRLGMTRYRTDKASYWLRDRYWDTDFYGITRAQWISNVRQTAAQER